MDSYFWYLPSFLTSNLLSSFVQSYIFHLYAFTFHLYCLYHSLGTHEFLEYQQSLLMHHPALLFSPLLQSVLYTSIRLIFQELCFDHNVSHCLPRHPHWLGDKVQTTELASKTLFPAFLLVPTVSYSKTDVFSLLQMQQLTFCLLMFVLPFSLHVMTSTHNTIQGNPTIPTLDVNSFFNSTWYQQLLYCCLKQLFFII